MEMVQEQSLWSSFVHRSDKAIVGSTILLTRIQVADNKIDLVYILLG